MAQKFSTLRKKKEKLLPLKVSVQIFLLISHVTVQSASSPGSPSLSQPGKRTGLEEGGRHGGGEGFFFFPGWGLGGGGGGGTECIDKFSLKDFL